MHTARMAKEIVTARMEETRKSMEKKGS